MNQPFDYRELESLALALPAPLEALRCAGDFDGELACIDRMLAEGVQDAGMRARLRMERVIAQGMRHDYRMDRAHFLARLREHYPTCDEQTVDALLASGHVDTIGVGGELRFQRAAVSNVLKCCRRILEEQAHPDVPYRSPDDPLLSDNCRRMAQNGGRAFRYRVRMSLTVDQEAQRPGQRIRVWLPMPAACASQHDIVLLDASGTPQLCGGAQPTAYFEETYEPGREFFVEFAYTHRVPYFAPDPAAVLPEQPHFDTEEQLPHIRFTPALRALAAQLRGDETNPLLLARRVYDYITTQVKYSYMREYLLMDSIAEFCAVHRRGDCGVQALLFITLCRILGIPARWESGNAVKPSGSVGSHDWAMFYVAPWGWMYADPSYGGGAHRRGDETLCAHYFGNLDPFRMVCATAFQQPFLPHKTYLRDDPYDNQSGEAEWDDAPLHTSDLTRRKVLIESTEIPFL